MISARSDEENFHTISDPEETKENTGSIHDAISAH
jgi:hypothetical protein